MGEPKRHIYVDHQLPLEELQDAEHATVTSEQFARRPPTTEDKFFYDQEQTWEEGEKEERREARHASLNRRSAKPTAPAPADEPDSVWQRIYRAFSRRSDSNWRP